MSAGTIVQVPLWNSPYLGNFMSSQLALAARARERFDLDTHFVLAHGAEGMPWLEDLDAAATSWSILSADRKLCRSHLDGVIAERSGVLVHSHFTEADIQAASAAAAAGVPCVWHVRTGFNGYPLRQRAKDLVKIRLVARRRVARIVAVSPWLGDLMRRRGVPAERIEVVPNAIATERFAHLPDRLAARRRLGLEQDAATILCLGWWPDVKGVDVFLDAMQPLATGHPNLRGLLIGEDVMREFLHRRIPGEPPSWLRPSGFVSDSALLFAAADMFVSASRHEGQSSALGEALACGLAVVMSDIRGTAAWGEAPHILTFPSEDADALRAQLERLLDQTPTERAAAGRENRTWVRENFALDAWCERMCGIYQELL